MVAVSCHALSPLFSQSGLASSTLRFNGSGVAIFLGSATQWFKHKMVMNVVVEVKEMNAYIYIYREREREREREVLMPSVIGLYHVFLS